MRFLVLLSYLMLAPVAQSVDGLDVEALRTELRDANDHNDGDRMVNAALRLRAEFPGHPGYGYLLARGQALRGETADALATLQDVATRGVDMLAHTRDDDAFAALRKHDGFASLVARVETLRVPIGAAQRAYSFGERGTMPEGVAIDASGQVFISNVFGREIIARDTDGMVRSWRDPELWSVHGLHFSPDGKRLWAVTSAMSATPGVDRELWGKSGLVAFDPVTGELLARHIFPGNGKHVLGDFAFVDHNTLLATDSMSGGVYALDTTSGAYIERVPPAVLRSPQGLAPLGDAIYVADYARGLYRLRLEDNDLVKVDDGPAAPYGIDGLYAHGNTLIAIQNGVQPHQVTRFTLSADGLQIVARETLLANHPDLDDPTLGTIRNNRFLFVANGQSYRFISGEDPPVAKMTAPVILSIPLTPAGND